MIEGKSFLAIIPARGGSKGIPRKNLRVVAGRTLLEWAWKAAKASAFLDRIILSSEDPEIIAIMQNLGCEVPFVRPTELATDTTPGIAPVIHAIETLPEKYDFVVLLQPTSPLRTTDDIDGAIKLCIERNAPACVSVGPITKSPHWMFRLDDDFHMRPLLPTNHSAADKNATIQNTARRQDLPSYFALNGAIYIARTNWIKKQKSFISPETIAYVMSRESSIDVDDEIDLIICEALLRRRQL